MPNTHTCIHLHIVFSTKNRVPLIATDFERDLHGYLGGIVRNQGGVCLEVGGIADHVHLLIGMKATQRLDYLMRELKASSSSWVKRNKNPKFSWQQGYGAFSVSPDSLGPVAKYIRNQKRYHMRLGFKDEYIRILERAKIQYDERYLW